MTKLEHPPPIEELPPSAKLVYKVLDYEGELTQPEIREETLLGSRTVRYALSRLQEEGVVESRPDLQDARRTHYSLQAGD